MTLRSIFYLHLFFILLGFEYASAQESQLISGTVMDANNGQGIPFASIGLKKQLIGIVTNEEGKFDLRLSTLVEGDSLMIIAIGYERSTVSLKGLNSPFIIRLKPAPVMLQEVEIIPLSPELYIRMAMRKTKQNYPSEPFESVAYYREKLLENKAFIKMDEGIFRTYCPNYQDTTKNQDQLLLYRTAEDLKELSFMSKERKKEEEKKKKGEKTEDKDVELDLTSSFGGPAQVLKSSRINKNSSSFLDTTQLDEYKYNFAKSGFGELMVIEFKSRGKVDHMRESGRIFIEPFSFAIVKIENNGDIIIPVLIRPILFFYGLGIENPSFSRIVEFQQLNDKWYPRNIHANIELNLTRRHFFARNEHSAFEIEQVYVVNRFNVDHPKMISAEKQFKSTKKMQEQVYNDENLSWETVNIIKR